MKFKPGDTVLNQVGPDQRTMRGTVVSNDEVLKPYDDTWVWVAWSNGELWLEQTCDVTPAN
jgi:hypothetical protein